MLILPALRLPAGGRGVSAERLQKILSLVDARSPHEQREIVLQAADKYRLECIEGEAAGDRSSGGEGETDQVRRLILGKDAENIGFCDGNRLRGKLGARVA